MKSLFSLFGDLLDDNYYLWFIEGYFIAKEKGGCENDILKKSIGWGIVLLKKQQESK